ncbi:dephospho-CoA kinase [Jatrophihabitans telluris]|uniref:Dephospho-CoA kinase n=1 Tax=Jatrophihabitans telluris TaxID=2038343 RepID=A0ABY4QVW0_9ACTN|nr:dephospho-CoA kinase [Jatrophihabitans telluris]UQX87120.1 dephospho-CoA kinase [Jatrophihabitans telluris]
MRRIALTGGIGSGKSTVADLLARRGAIVIDADQIAREVVAVGTPGLTAVINRFGRDLLAADGSLDRPALARLVFADRAALADLNAIVHPLVGARSAELMARVPDGGVAVYDVPLLVENGTVSGWDEVVVVQAPMALRLSRLRGRGLPEDEARNRMARQAGDEQRRQAATILVDNDGTLEELAARVDAAWPQISGETPTSA